MAGIKEEKKIYLVGIYCRLSKDDGTDNESASIATQKSILTDYVKKQGWHIAKTYVDDGYSGTNFQRPSFQNMIKDIESGLINCVITKDLSRLGRNYLDCGLYLEVFFPEHNVRYIAVNDGVDTLNKSAMDITPFRNILNEMYAADISVKIKSAYRARFQQGKFMGTTAPYGYIKDPADHNHLLIDDKVAHVVKEIFDLALKGNGVAKICRHLNKQHILRPAAYAAERGETGFERHFEGNEDKRYIWSGNSVRSILRSPIYAGNLVGYKRIAANMKSKKRPSKLPEEWEVIPNTHEGIVTQEEFDIVQQLITSRRLPQNDIVNIGLHFFHKDVRLILSILVYTFFTRMFDLDCQHFFRQIFLGYFSDIVQAFDTLRKNVCGDDYTSLHNPIVLSSVLPAYGMFHSIQILFL